MNLSELRSHLEPLDPFEVVQNLEALVGSDGAPSGIEPGWVIVPTELDPKVVVELLTRLAARSGTWSVLLVHRASDGVEVVPVSPGYRTDVPSVAARLEQGAAHLGLLSFRHSLGELARIRHDVNNPLTAALAEAQLVLMDVEPGSETETSLRAVEEQLRRIRDLVAELTLFRVPDPPPG